MQASMIWLHSRDNAVTFTFKVGCFMSGEMRTKATMQDIRSSTLLRHFCSWQPD